MEVLWTNFKWPCSSRSLNKDRRHADILAPLTFFNANNHYVASLPVSNRQLMDSLCVSLPRKAIGVIAVMLALTLIAATTGARLACGDVEALQQKNELDVTQSSTSQKKCCAFLFCPFFFHVFSVPEVPQKVSSNRLGFVNQVDAAVRQTRDKLVSIKDQKSADDMVMKTVVKEIF